MLARIKHKYSICLYNMMASVAQMIILLIITPFRFISDSSVPHVFDLILPWSGFGGLEVACWPLVPKFAGSNPAKAVEFLRVNKNPQHFGGAWMFVCCDCCVLSGRGLCDGLITRSEESYRLWCVVV